MPNASDGKKFPYTKKGMADYEKYQGSLDRYNKTMGFEHNNTNSSGEIYKRQGKFISAKVKNLIQDNEGEVAGATMSMLSEFGNRGGIELLPSFRPDLPYKSKKKLVKGT